MPPQTEWTRDRTDQSAGWVEHWLARYCLPGQHHFSQPNAMVASCARCNKHEIVGRTVCMICEILGEVHAVISKGDEVRQEGALCGCCADEFRSRGRIQGWSAQILSHEAS